MNDQTYSISPIGHIEGCYPDKFGVPRQPGLAPTATADIVLTGIYATADAIRGIEAYSHLWITFIFNLSPMEWNPLVRPPRLGGNRKIGVFASRSTHRPNRLGLSLVELIGVDMENGVRLKIRGHDLVDDTPVVDIKPYLPWAESRPEARGGFAAEAPPLLPVIFSSQAQEQLAKEQSAQSIRQLIIEVLAQDPRPAYHDKENNRVYGIRLRHLNVRFQMIQANNQHLIEVVDLAQV